MFERGAVTLFRVRGIPVRAHWTLLLVLPYLAVVFTLQFEAVARLAGLPPASVQGPPLLWGALLAIGLFASIGLHELAHTLVAVHSGGRVRDITLMLLGGVSHFERMPRRPRTEAAIAVVGPLTSLALGGLLLLLLRVMPVGAGDLRFGLFYLAALNLLLGVFNLLPAFPMDGGRVLRAALAAWLGEPRATTVAAGIGTALAVVMGIWGLWVGNFLLLLIAVFVFAGAQLEAHSEKVSESLRGLRVADLILAPGPTIPATAPLSDVLPRMHAAGRLELVVVDEAGHATGIVRARDLVDIPSEERASRTVHDLGARLTVGVHRVLWNQSAAEALEEAATHRADHLLVVDPHSGTTVGLLGVSDIESTVVLRGIEARWAAPVSGPRPV